MAEEIKSAHGIEAELEKGSGGIFEIFVDGDLIYSKKETGSFPADGQILSLLESRAG